MWNRIDSRSHVCSASFLGAGIPRAGDTPVLARLRGTERLLTHSRPDTD